MKTTARLLSEFIEKRSITFTSLSESVGISRPTLNLLLTGRQPISLERAKKIADALSIDDTELKLLYAALERESEALASHARFKQRLVFSKTALPLMLKVFEASQQLDEPLDSTAMEGIEHPVYLGWADLRSKEIEKIRIFAGFEPGMPILALGVPDPRSPEIPPPQPFFRASLEAPFNQQEDVVVALADHMPNFKLYKPRDISRVNRSKNNPDKKA